MSSELLQSSERTTPPLPRMVDLMEEALTAPGRLGDTYSRFYDYSLGNQLWLRMQGANEPVASYNGWKKLGRQVVKGAKAYYILRPITVKSRTEVDDEGQPKQFTTFKPVKGAFPYSMTEGEELPEPEPREWSAFRAMGALGIKYVDFNEINGNVQGISWGKNVAVNPVAKFPLKTLTHEISHVVHGHTTDEGLAEYQTHRGIKEFEAESTAYLVLNETDLVKWFDPAESRAYISSWLHGEKPGDDSIRRVFKVTDLILKAGRKDNAVASEETEVA